MKTYRLNKETVIECAMDLVAESGIEGLRLNKIADRLQVKSPSLYTHTGSVTELRSTVVCQAMNQFRERLVAFLVNHSQLHTFIDRPSHEYFLILNSMKKGSSKLSE